MVAVAQQFKRMWFSFKHIRRPFRRLTHQGFALAHCRLQPPTLPIKNTQSHLGSMNTTAHHRAKRGTHPVGPIHLAQLHPANHQSRHHLARALDNRILRRVHVQSAHPAELVNGPHGFETLGRKGARGSVVARRGDDDRRVDSGGVHAALCVVIERDERPVGDDAGDLDAAVRHVTSDEVFDGGGVEEFDVGKGEDAGEERRGEQSGVFNHHEGRVGRGGVGHAKGVEEVLRRLAKDHRRHELSAEPRATAC